MSTQHFSTQALHAGHDVQQTLGARAVPIYQSCSYVFENTEQAAGVFNLSIPGYIYTRLNNPTNAVLEERLTALEGGIGAVVTSSGMAAITTALLTLLRAGDHIVAANSLYGGTYNLLSVSLPRLGITTTFVDPDQPENFEAAIQENTRLVLGESLGNPKLDVLDIEAIAKIAHQAKIPLLIDNTVASPYLLKPFDYGADLVVHSLTKYISGNGTSIGGVIIDAGNFDWTNGLFPEFTQASPGYQGLIYSQAFGKAAFIGKARVEGLRDYGAALSPFNAFQIIQGLETLPLRIEKHSQNAQALAEWLEKQAEVAWVNYPGLASSKYHDLAEKYLPNGKSGLLTFGLKGGFEAAQKIANDTQLFSLLANLGDTKSLVIHPASTTHQQLSEQAQKEAGISPELIRLSVGIEDIEDLKKDLRSVLDGIIDSNCSKENKQNS